MRENMSYFKEDVETILQYDFRKNMGNATVKELYLSVSKAAVKSLGIDWNPEFQEKKVCYLSGEYLMGRLVYQNLLNLGMFNQFSQLMSEYNLDIRIFEEVWDAALGSGGIGRQAACFLESGATLNLALNGYGIRYRYGLFRQYFENGLQKEKCDNWLSWGDPWSVRKEEEKVIVEMKGLKVKAVPYDTPIIGYGKRTINTLRLWQAEPLEEFDFQAFRHQQYRTAVKERENAEELCSVLYPNSSFSEGEKLRLRQQYFLASASMQDLVRGYKNRHGSDFSKFSSEYAIQLNECFPVLSIVVLMCIFMEEEGMTAGKAFKIIRETFSFSSSAILPETMERWDFKVLKATVPKICKYISYIQKILVKELKQSDIMERDIWKYFILDDKKVVYMDRLAIFSCHCTDCWKKVWKEWRSLYPNYFMNKAYGITQRRWLVLANMELSGFITDKIGNSWITNLDRLKELEPLAEDLTIIKEFDNIKRIKKQQLAEYIKDKEGVRICPEFAFDIQLKNIKEDKRQLLNAFSILDIYFYLKENRTKEFYPTCFIFGGKAEPDDFRAKGIIKYIYEIAKMIAGDKEVNDKLQVVFVTNYNVSYAEKLMPAADFSQQISAVGTEAGGTGGLKFMLNGAVTLGTYNEINIEIAKQAGQENNYLFGTKEDRDFYSPMEFYKKEKRIKRVVDTLIDGILDDGGTGMFQELFHALLVGSDIDKPDPYGVLFDFIPYCETRLRGNRDYYDSTGFRVKCFLNLANSGQFSSDRVVKDYWEHIWNT